MNGKMQRIRAWAKIIVGLGFFGLFVYMSLTGQIDHEFRDSVIWAVLGAWLMADGVAKTTQ